VTGYTAKVAGESAGGLFAGTSGPKPPPALSTAVIGMRPGGKVCFSFCLYV
jgi:peptidylprolyl isomerase